MQAQRSHRTQETLRYRNCSGALLGRSLPADSSKGIKPKQLCVWDGKGALGREQQLKSLPGRRSTSTSIIELLRNPKWLHWGSNSFGTSSDKTRDQCLAQNSPV